MNTPTKNKSTKQNPKLTDEQVCRHALIDLFARDVAELRRTKQPGAASCCRKLKAAIKELSENLPPLLVDLLP